MPPKKGTSTPNKPPDNPTWTLDEGEEMRRDINDLQKNTVTKDELQEMMEGLKGEIMEGLKNFILERTPESENVSHEIHDEDTRKVNQEWRNSNFGLKTNHIPKVDMRNFDGKDPITWILQMEQFFDLHNVSHTQKVRIASLYLESNQFVWYRWICSLKSLVTWTIFTEEMIAHYEDTRSNAFFSQSINIKQKGSVTEHIENFQRLNIKVTNILDEHLIDVFIGTLKDNIQHEVLLWEPKSLENAFKVA
jgi:gas vesicle protein